MNRYTHSSGVIQAKRAAKFCGVMAREKPNYKHNYEIYNQTKTPLVMCDRFGLKTVLGEKATSFILEEPCIVIAHKLTITGSAAVAAVRQQLQSPHLESHLNKMGNNFIVSGYRDNTLELAFESVIKLTELQSMGGSVYYTDIDLLFSVESLNDAPYHPCSPEARITKLTSPTDDGTLIFDVFVVDNANEVGTVYYNVNGDIHPLQPKRYSKLKSGCYYTAPGVNGKVTEVIPFNDKDALKAKGFFLTESDALDFGNIEQAEKKELLSLQKQLSDMANEKQAKQQEFDLLKLELENERMQAEHKLNAAKMNLDLQGSEIKHHYNNLSLDRKDTSEFLKFLPNLAIGVGTLLTCLLLI